MANIIEKYMWRSWIYKICKLTNYNTTKTWTSSSNFRVKMQYSSFVEDLPVAASGNQLMEEYES